MKHCTQHESVSSWLAIRAAQNVVFAIGRRMHAVCAVSLAQARRPQLGTVSQIVHPPPCQYIQSYISVFPCVAPSCRLRTHQVSL